MNGLVRTRGRFFVLLAPLALILVAVPAGRSDAAEGNVSPTTVIEGLKTIQQGLADAVAAGDDTAKAHEAVEAVAPVWAMIEGTVKNNDEKSYASFEKSIEDLEAAIKAGDARGAGGAVGAFASAVTGYVGKFPATGPSGASSRTADAAPAADRSAAAAAPTADRTAAAPAEAGDATLARTGSMSDAVTALAGLALALGGLSVIGGARRRPSPIV